MRLAEKERSAICNVIREADGEASIYLFGSRVNDSAKGGGYRPAGPFKKNFTHGETRYSGEAPPDTGRAQNRYRCLSGRFETFSQNGHARGYPFVTHVKIELLQEDLAGLQLAAGHLQYSIERCRNLIGQEALPPEQLERLESLTSRFARLADLLIQRVFRLIDEIELTSGGSILDRIYRAEKRA